MSRHRKFSGKKNLKAMQSPQKPRGESLRKRAFFWLSTMSPALKFVFRFMGCTLCFFALSLLPNRDAVLSSCLTGDARLSAWLLNLVGENCQVSGTSMSWAGHGIRVASGCSAFEYAVFLCAAVFSFPAPFMRKIFGALAGLAILLAVNLIRIASLFWIGVHYPAFFDTVHVALWPGVLVVITVLVCTGWIQWVASRNEPRPV